MRYRAASNSPGFTGTCQTPPSGSCIPHCEKGDIWLNSAPSFPVHWTAGARRYRCSWGQDHQFCLGRFCRDRPARGAPGRGIEGRWCRLAVVARGACALRSGPGSSRSIGICMRRVLGAAVCGRRLAEALPASCKHLTSPGGDTQAPSGASTTGARMRRRCDAVMRCVLLMCGCLNPGRCVCVCVVGRWKLESGAVASHRTLHSTQVTAGRSTVEGMARTLKRKGPRPRSRQARTRGRKAPATAFPCRISWANCSRSWFCCRKVRRDYGSVKACRRVV